jgi:hypothetical protein
MFTLFQHIIFILEDAMHGCANQQTRADLQARVRVRGVDTQVCISALSISDCTALGWHASVRPGDLVSISFECGIKVSGKIESVGGQRSTVRFNSPLHPSVVHHLGFDGDSGR